MTDPAVKAGVRRTAILLWLVVSVFFFGVMLKYYWLAQ